MAKAELAKLEDKWAESAKAVAGTSKSRRGGSPSLLAVCDVLLMRTWFSSRTNAGGSRLQDGLPRERRVESGSSDRAETSREDMGSRRVDCTDAGEYFTRSGDGLLMVWSRRSVIISSSATRSAISRYMRGKQRYAGSHQR